MIFIFSSAAALHVVSVFSGFKLWVCPIKASIGINCPGCGLGTAISLLIQGKWRLALSIHLFSPIVFVTLILFTIIGFMPYHSYDKMVKWIFMIEKNTGVSAFLLLGIIFYWVARLLHVL